MSVDKFPQLDVLDFHKKRDLFKDYKVGLKATTFFTVKRVKLK
jgi:hypothetical protein